MQSPGLLPAQHADCAAVGDAVLRYLLTGDDSGHPQLDAKLGQDRADLVSRPQDAREPLARQVADLNITSCEQGHASQDAADASSAAAASSSSVEAARQASQSAAQDRQRAAFGAACQRLGGTTHTGGWAGPYCTRRYGDGDDTLPLQQDGTLDQGQAGDNRDTCAGLAQTARDNASVGAPWHVLPTFHANTGVCDTGSP